MKTFITLFILTILTSDLSAQAILNEVYCQPGNGYNEFFELFNQNTTPVPEKLDNYTLVTYYEESGGKSGFYVLDFPDDTVSSQKFYVMSSALTFNIQSQPGLTANENWNAIGAGGSLTKWESNGSTYTSVAVPANLNDLFVKITGPGGVFHIFLYKNGIMVNGIIAGQNSTTIPSYIKAMPDLFVDMSGTSPDFTVKFSTLPDNCVEYISSSAGTNNGYYRQYDGLCGTWLKSDQPGQHNPRFTNQTNGNAYTGITQIEVTSVISLYATDPNYSVLTFNITSGSAEAFPVVVSVYLDKGLLEEWDISDSLFTSVTVYNANEGNHNILIPGNDVAVILDVRAANDCYNQTRYTGAYSTILPADLLVFSGSLTLEEKVTLDWTVGNNESVSHFELERSTDGSDFKTIALMMTSEKTGAEQYRHLEKINGDKKVMYRLKIYDTHQAFTYSRTLVFGNTSSGQRELQITGNPVKDRLSFGFESERSQHMQVRIYNMNGSKLMNENISSREGYNMMVLPLNQSFSPGMYILELYNGSERLTKKFIKQ